MKQLASFSRFEAFEIDFINKACESIAICIPQSKWRRKYIYCHRYIQIKL